jgi:hypothetical protein
VTLFPLCAAGSRLNPQSTGDVHARVRLHQVIAREVKHQMLFFACLMAVVICGTA